MLEKCPNLLRNSSILTKSLNSLFFLFTRTSWAEKTANDCHACKSNTLMRSAIHSTRCLLLLVSYVCKCACGTCICLYACWYGKQKYNIDVIAILFTSQLSFSLFHHSSHHTLCFPQAVSRLFDNCSPLLNGCKKNRENWLHLAAEAQEGTSENSCTVTMETQKNNEEDTQIEE